METDYYEEEEYDEEQKDLSLKETDSVENIEDDIDDDVDDYEFETIIETVDVTKDLDYYDTFETEDFTWNAECTKLFLNLYRDRIHLFRDPKVKKKLIWKQIQDIFRNLGYSIGLLALAGKFRNLKRTYKQIHFKISENENYPNKWPYYDSMTEILDENIEIDEESKAIFVSELFDEPEVNLFNWNDERIMLLLNAYKDRKIEFAKFRKINTKSLWKEIKAIFWSHNIKITVEQLHKKYRLLRGTFRKIQEKQNRRGPYESKWPYFKIFEQIIDVPRESVQETPEPTKKSAKSVEITDYEGSDKSFWTEDMVKLLITLYTEKKHKFKNPLIKKKRLWKQIKTDFNLHGHDVTGEMLYKKFQNLKNTFQKINQRHGKSDNVFTRWPYYTLMQNVLKNHDQISFDSDYIDDEEDYIDDENDEEYKPRTAECYYWSLEAVKILLSAYRERIKQFADKNVKKMDLWKEIKEHLDTNGFDIEQVIVEKKFRTLKHRYLQICSLKQQETCRWNFFQLMSTILNADGSFKLDDPKAQFNDTSDDDTPYSWSSEKVQLLLDSYYERKDSFFNPQTKNRNLWLEIVEVFAKNGYSANEDVLSEKYRQLRNNYLRYRNKRDSTGVRNSKWEFYDLMSKIYEKNSDSDLDNSTTETRIFHWTYETTKLLIYSYNEFKDKFNNPHIRNASLWSDMTKIFLSKNHEVTPTMLNKKFNTLKRTYMRNRLKLSKGEMINSKWLFFSSMHKIFYEEQILKEEYIQEDKEEYDDLDEDDDNYPDFQFIEPDTSSEASPKKDIKLETTTTIEIDTANLEEKINVHDNDMHEKINERFNVLENRLHNIEALISKNNELQVASNDMMKKFLSALHDRL